jgi:hypothetical protein
MPSGTPTNLSTDAPDEPAVSQVHLSNDPTIVKIHLQSCITALRDEDGRSKTRELSLAVTKIQEAAMWIDEHLRVS